MIYVIFDNDNPLFATDNEKKATLTVLDLQETYDEAEDMHYFHVHEVKELK